MMISGCGARWLGWAAVLGLAGGAVAADPPAIGATLDGLPGRPFPASPAVVDVTRAPYNARGDGRADDTRAIQQALSDVMGRHKVVYLPAGTYLVSSTIRWSKRDSKGNDAWGFNTLRGPGASSTTIRLKDDTFADAREPRPILRCGGFGSADWFHNYVEGITFDVGRGNPGAIGLQFYSNNTGAVRDLAIVSGDGQGSIGLDLAPADMNGPLLVRDVLVRGFEVGIRTGGSVNSQTFERVTLSGQSRVGLANLGQSIAVRGLLSENAVPAIDSEGFAAVLGSRLVGRGAASRVAAIEPGPGDFYARDVATEGYRVAIARARDGREVAGPAVDEFAQGSPSRPFDPKAGALRLPVAETPDVPWDDPATWAVVDAFGADPTGQADSSGAIQKAIDSGASTVFFPGAYDLSRPVRVRGRARRLLGVGNWVDYLGHSRPDFIVEDGESPVVVIEHFAPINGGIGLQAGRSVVLRSVEARTLERGGRGDLFLEDFCSHDLRFGPGRRTWARQLNVENEGTHVDNDGGSLWVLGLKTERGGTLLRTRAGGRSEVLGTFSYTTTAGGLAPMFVTEDASVFAFFREVCYSGDPFRTLIRETRRGSTREVRRGEGGATPYATRPAD